MPKSKSIKLNQNERVILSYAVEHEKFTLSDLTKRFLRLARAPRRWAYATEVEPDERKRWLASLLARNGIRRLTRERLVRKVSPGIYRVTASGMASIRR